MDGDRIFEIIGENFNANSCAVSKKLEMRLGIINSALLSTGDGKLLDSGKTELIGLYKTGLSDFARLQASDDTPDVIKPHIEAYSKALSVADVVSLSRMMYEDAIGGGKFSRYDLLESGSAQIAFSEDVRIVYRKAYGADTAFEKFASLIPDAAALYRDTFPEVCDAVALGDADMCILPYENTEDGKLGSFYKLIESYDLKIAASSMVRSNSRDDKTRYLLLSKSLVGLSMISGITDFEFSISDRSDGMLTRTLAAADLLCLNVRSIDTVRHDTEVTVYDVRVTASDSAIDEFILYLLLEEAYFTPLGLYAVID